MSFSYRTYRSFRHGIILLHNPQKRSGTVWRAIPVPKPAPGYKGIPASRVCFRRRTERTEVCTNPPQPVHASACRSCVLRSWSSTTSTSALPGYFEEDRLVCRHSGPAVCLTVIHSRVQQVGLAVIHREDVHRPCSLSTGCTDVLAHVRVILSTHHGCVYMWLCSCFVRVGRDVT